MSAYKVLLDVSCNMEGCAKKANHAVYNAYNSLQGNYCTKHANEKVDRLKNLESKGLPNHYER